MKIITLFKFCILFLLILPFTALADSAVPLADSAVQWTATVTESHTACKNIGKDIEGVYDVILKYGEGKTLTLMVVKSGHIFNGVVVDENPQKIKLQASYLEDAGVVTDNVNITFTSENSGTGTSKWYWSDGLMSCGGSYEFIISR